MSGDPRSTRELAEGWLASARDGGISGESAAAFTGPNLRLNLPRSLAPLLAGAAIDTPANRLSDLDAALDALIDLRAVEVREIQFSSFEGDFGAIQGLLRVRTRKGKTLDAAVAATFRREGDTLAAIWIHADTSDICRGMM